MAKEIVEPLGVSEVFVEFQQRLSRAAKVDRPVLIIGERGTGKELAASRLHFLSGRWNAAFVALNCSALPPGLIESELFGHERGAFTGAAESRKGRFEEADGGTLFLDEIGLIPMEVQEKILRAVEYSTFQRVGNSQSVEVDVRIIGTANQDLRILCEEGRFKYDLLDRLSFEVLFLPPLRERGEDILILAEHFAAQMARELGRPGEAGISERARAQILSHHWPGNIRELKNTVERAVYRKDDSFIEELELDPFQNPWSPASSDGGSAQPYRETESPWPRDLKKTVEVLEIRWMEEAMEKSDRHQGRAATLLGLTYNQFRGLYRKYYS